MKTMALLLIIGLLAATDQGKTSQLGRKDGRFDYTTQMLSGLQRRPPLLPTLKTVSAQISITTGWWSISEFARVWRDFI